GLEGISRRVPDAHNPTLPDERDPACLPVLEQPRQGLQVGRKVAGLGKAVGVGHRSALQGTTVGSYRLRGPVSNRSPMHEVPFVPVVVRPARYSGRTNGVSGTGRPGRRSVAVA